MNTLSVILGIRKHVTVLVMWRHDALDPDVGAGVFVIVNVLKLTFPGCWPTIVLCKVFRVGYLKLCVKMPNNYSPSLVGSPYGERGNMFS